MDRRLQQLAGAIVRMHRRVTTLETRTAPLKRKRNRVAPRHVVFVRLVTNLLPGQVALCELVNWDTGTESWRRVGTGEMVIRDPTCTMLALKCDVVAATQQAGNEFHTYAPNPGPVMAAAMDSGNCGDTLRFCLGEGCELCLCDDTGCSGSEDPGSESDSGSDEPECTPGRLITTAEYVGDGPIREGDLALIQVQRHAWWQRLLLGSGSGSGSGPEACRLVATRACGNACATGSEEPCVVFETDVRCEQGGSLICIYKRARELVVEGGQIVCANATDWMLQQCCPTCCDGSGSGSGSGSSGSSGSEPYCCDDEGDPEKQVPDYWYVQFEGTGDFINESDYVYATGSGDTWTASATITVGGDGGPEGFEAADCLCAPDQFTAVDLTLDLTITRKPFDCEYEIRTVLKCDGDTYWDNTTTFAVDEPGNTDCWCPDMVDPGPDFENDPELCQRPLSTGVNIFCGNKAAPNQNWGPPPA